MKNTNWFLWENVGSFYYCKKSQSVSNGQNVMKTLILSQNISAEYPLGETVSLTLRPLENFFNEKQETDGQHDGIDLYLCFVFVRG